MGNRISYNKFNKNKNNKNHDDSGSSGRSSINDESYQYVNGRRYLKDCNSYMLPNDEEEIDRLQSQHYLHWQIWRSNFSSPIETILKLGGVEVLDVGCGSGLWSLEMAALYPLSNFTGIDIAPQYPMDTHPLNTTFESVDITRGLPYPDHRFDFIHVKVLLSYIPEKQMKLVINELMRVLKPGGWLEIMDYGDIINPGPAFTTFYNACKELEKLLPKYGLVDVHFEEKVTMFGKKGGPVGVSSVEDWETVFLIFQKLLLEFSCMDSESYCKLIQDFKEEVDEYESAFKLFRFYGRKPQTKFLL
ncbi:7357_t:CDS:2 [Funneliformis mosseae]|uniref:7357_t:CDS:1 n=1 Tax=Funneliformis mosseae TaxID=27381 RepID=A0A9N8VEJ6_FUNMO|nr:7357_t:CDS:2 [Funneliformis mosseae]